MGLIYLQSNRSKNAAEFFNKELEINPLNSVALNNLGVINLNLKNYIISKNYFLKALKTSANAKTYYFLGLIYEELEDFDNAIKFYQQSIQIKKNANTLCNIGHLYYFLGSLSNAKKNTLEAIKMNPKHDTAYNNLGLINMANGHLKDAKKNFLDAIKHNQNNTRAYFNISKLLNYKNNHKQFQKLLNLSNSAKLNKEKEFIYFALGKAFDDKECFKKAFYY